MGTVGGAVSDVWAGRVHNRCPRGCPGAREVTLLKGVISRHAYLAPAVSCPCTWESHRQEVTTCSQLLPVAASGIHHSLTNQPHVHHRIQVCTSFS